MANKRIAPADPPDGAQTVRRAMSVLRLVAEGQDRGVRLTDVAAMSGLARPTVHRLLKVLMDEMAVEQDAGTRRYRIVSRQSLDAAEVQDRKRNTFRGNLHIADASKFWAPSKYLVLVEQ